VHQPTLFVTAAVAIALSGLLLWIARPAEQRFDPLSIWAISMACAAAGMVLAAVPSVQFVQLDLARALMLLGIGIAWTAAHRFAQQRPHLGAACAGAVIWLVAMQSPALRRWDALHTPLANAITGVYAIAIIAALRQVEPLRARRPAMILTGLYAGLLLLHGGLRLAGVQIGKSAGFMTDTGLLAAQVEAIGVALLMLAMTNERAERRVAEALTIAQDAAEARRRFLAHLSHEIRTPLNGVLALAHHLARDTSLKPVQAQQVDTLEAAGRHLLAIVNDTLDLARIDAGAVELVSRPFDPAVSAEGCLSLVRAAAVDKRIALRLTVDPATPPRVSGDSTRLQQILLNVLWNALKFTPAGGRVEMRVTQTNGIRFEVTDTGPGIPQAARERLFQEFSPLDPEFGGTGLGLAISARLATRMGGQLGYHPRPQGTGSMFRLDLPWDAVAPEPEAMPAPEASPQVTGLNLLVVDDVPANRFLLRTILTTEGHRATEAASCAEALIYLRTERFDAVLLDLRMPEVDGMETARRIRSLNDRVTASVPLIAVSADPAPETAAACYAAGMVGVITKPIERETLLAELQRLETSEPRLVSSA
jgi:signal transduction histidine kinase/CheY-like chemotaxis protein